MQREISNRVFLGQAVSPYEDAGWPSAIDRTASNYNDAKEKIIKMRELISTEKYGEDIARCIPGSLRILIPGKKSLILLYIDMEDLDFQIILTESYSVNPNSIHICFLMKILKKA